MVWITHTNAYPEAYAHDPRYRIVTNPAGGYDVFCDPPADPLSGVDGWAERPSDWPDDPAPREVGRG